MIISVTYSPIELIIIALVICFLGGIAFRFGEYVIDTWDIARHEHRNNE